jgi:hypothetical protein
MWWASTVTQELTLTSVIVVPYALLLRIGDEAQRSILGHQSFHQSLSIDEILLSPAPPAIGRRKM